MSPETSLDRALTMTRDEQARERETDRRFRAMLKQAQSETDSDARAALMVAAIAYRKANRTS